MKLELISRYPTAGDEPTPVLFVHGMLFGAWCWEQHFLEFFARHGYAAHAVNLRGHGNSEGRERLRWARIADFVEDDESLAVERCAAGREPLSRRLQQLGGSSWDP